MSDVARAAGISRGAASFALNDRPGVSDETRARVKRLAQEMGWTAPSSAAIALSSRRAGAVGLVIARPPEAFATESFFLRFIAGVETALQPQSVALVLHVVPDLARELRACRRLAAEGRVDGMLLVDPRADDPRPALLERLGMPGVMVGGSSVGERVSGIVTDDAGALTTVVEHLAKQGHRHIAYVVGRGEPLHAVVRSRAIADEAASRRMKVTWSAFTDATEAAGRLETERLLQRNDRPTAVVYDNEILALGGLGAIQTAGLECPRDVAVVSCEESPVCRVVTPQLTSLVRDPGRLGSRAASLLLGLVAGRPAVVEQADAPVLVRRASTLIP